MGSAAMPIMMGMGGLLGAGAANQGARAQAAMYEMQRRVSLQAAKAERHMAKYNAVMERASARNKGDKILRAGERWMGKLTTLYAVSGVEGSTGSAADVATDQILTIQQKKAEAILAGESRADMALYKGELAAWNHVANANIQGYAAQSTIAAGQFEAFGSLLGGAYDITEEGGWGAMGNFFGGLLS